MMLVRSAVFCFAALVASGANAQSPEACEDQVLRGFTEPTAIVEVASREPGLLAHMHVKPGERVEAGALLAELDKTVAEADADAARSRATASGRVEVAEARNALARERLAEMDKLRRSGAARRLELIAARAEAAITAAEVQAAEDERAGAAADLARAEARLTLFDIVAPISGVVREVHRRVGEFVGAAGDPRVVTLLDDQQLEIDFFAPYPCLIDVSPGMKADMRFGPSGSRSGEIIELGVEIDAATGLRRIRVAIENTDAAILSGQRAELNVPIRQQDR